MSEDASARASSRLPLLEAFLDLRRLDFQLGIPEYVAVLTALDEGIGVGGPGTWREDVTFLCQALWAKSVDQREQVRAVVTRALPAPPTEHEIRLAVHGPDATDREEAPPPQPPSFTAPQPPAGPLEAPAAGPAQAVPAPAVRPALDVGTLALPDTTPAALRAAVHTRFDLTGALPVTYRQMYRAWRQYRRMARTGPPVELDAAATLDRFARQGVLAEPAFVPRRRNRARALVLVDVQGSMVPFRHLTRALLKAASHAGLARVDIRYFHDVPGARIFRDTRLHEPQKLGEAAAPFVDSGIMILSDAGAARRGLDAERVAATGETIELLRRTTPALAWLNPVPPDRWPSTTAAAIRDATGIAMFGFDRHGVESAIATMRGQIR